MRDSNVVVREGLASNHSTTYQTLAKLASDKNFDVGTEVALSLQGADAENLLPLLAKSKDEKVRSAVAFNPSVSPVVLDSLADDQSSKSLFFVKLLR